MLAAPSAPRGPLTAVFVRIRRRNAVSSASQRVLYCDCRFAHPRTWVLSFTLGRQTPLGATMFDATQTQCGACFWQGDGSTRCLHRRCSGRRVVGISDSPLFHAGSLAKDMLYAESCAASAALNSVPESQLASAPDLFSIDRDNQVIDSCPGVVQPPAATTQCCVTTPAPARHSLVIHLLACVWLIVQWNVVPDSIRRWIPTVSCH